MTDRHPPPQRRRAPDGAARRRARARLGEDDGLSLIELLIVAILITVAGGLVLVAITGGFRSSMATTDHVRAMNELQRGVEIVGDSARASHGVRCAATGRLEVAVPEVGDDGDIEYQVRHYRIVTADGERRLIERRTIGTIKDPDDSADLDWQRTVVRQLEDPWFRVEALRDGDAVTDCPVDDADDADDPRTIDPPIDEITIEIGRDAGERGTKTVETTVRPRG